MIDPIYVPRAREATLLRALEQFPALPLRGDDVTSLPLSDL